MDLKNLPVTPLPAVKLDEQQQTLLEHNRLFGALLGESIFNYAGLHIYQATERLPSNIIKQKIRKAVKIYPLSAAS